jgi:UPF0755 protein
VIKYVLALVCILLLTALAAFGWLVVIYPEERASGSGQPGQPFQVTLPQGSSAREVAERLASHRVGHNASLFALYARLIGADRKFRAGVVTLSNALTVSDVIQRVTETSGEVNIRVTIPEGYQRFEIAELLEHRGVCGRTQFLEATENGPLLADLEISASNAEGYLFPDTYLLTNHEEAQEIVRRLVLNWRKRVTPLLKEHAKTVASLQRDLSWGTFEVLTLASIVEKEAALPAERPVIAGVFLNRLLRADFRPKLLQADPTVAYGCVAAPQKAPSCAGYRERQITRHMLDDPANLYNTYRHEGLPPGPISNPGLDAMEAVLSPETHDYLYFVASDGGHHQFSITIDAHHRAVQNRKR